MRHAYALAYKRRDLSYFTFTPSTEMDVEVFFAYRIAGATSRTPTNTRGYAI